VGRAATYTGFKDEIDVAETFAESTFFTAAAATLPAAMPPFE
jgi:hypothetical protein